MMETTGITNFFRGRSVFITGGSGFMGKVLIEKLLRSCPDLEYVYVLLRPKKGQKVAGRLIDLLDSKLFDGIKETNKHLLNKVVALPGDITQPDLGLSSADQEQLIRNVSVVFHAAATVKFDESIRVSVSLNLIGTISLLQLCEKFEKLESVVHVSTAYTNCNLEEDIYEQLYPTPAKPQDVIQLVDILDDETLKCLTPRLLKDRPNTYTYTKALAEQVVYEKSGQLPIAIFRPSIVTSAIREPMPGWIDSLNGPTGMLAGVGKGILRSLVCHRDSIADLIPVDIAINCMIAIAWHTATARPNDIMIYNCTTGSSNPIYWGEVESRGLECLRKYPSKEIVWYPGGSFKTSTLMNEIHIFSVQVLPAYLHDLLSKLTGKKPMMMKLQGKLKKAINTMTFFTTKEFRFRNDHVLQLYSTLNPEDQKTFCFDINGINWNDYLETYILGMRKFVLKEELSTLAESRSNLRKLYMLHRATQVLVFSFVFWGVIMRSNTARLTFYQILSFLFKSITAATGIFLKSDR